MRRGDGSLGWVRIDAKAWTGPIRRRGDPGLRRHRPAKTPGERLRAAKDAAEAGAKAKSDFLAAMSHEIRTHLNGVVGMTEPPWPPPSPRKQRDYLEAVRDSATPSWPCSTTSWTSPRSRPAA